MWSYDDIEIDDEKVDFLDLLLFRWGARLHYAPYVKPTSTGVPLSTLSVHPGHVHIMWMKSRIGTFARRSSTHKIFVDARSQFIARLQKFNMPGPVIKQLAQYDPYLDAIVRQSLSSTPLAGSPAPARGVTAFNEDREGRETTFWVPLPFHPLWSRANFGGILREATEAPHMRQLLLVSAGYDSDHGQRFVFRVAWKIQGASFAASIRRLNFELT